MTAEEIRRSILEVSRQIIRLYAQFTEGVRVVKANDLFNKTRVYYVDGKTVGSDDVYLESENELLYTHNQRKDMIFKLYNSGLLFDDEGKLRTSTKEKVLSLLGYKDLDYQKGLSRLHEEKAIEENEKLRTSEVDVDEIDDHSIHVDEHTRYLLSEYSSVNKEQKQRFIEHINKHKKILKNLSGE